jgi:hypothetical protein
MLFTCKILEPHLPDLRRGGQAAAESCQAGAALREHWERTTAGLARWPRFLA